MSFGIAVPESTPLFQTLLFTQQGPTLLFAIGGIMLSGTLIGWFAQLRIRYFRKIKLRVAERKLRAKQLIRILEGLARTNCDQRVRQILGERLVVIIEQIMDINPNEAGIKIIHAATQKLMQLPAKQTTYDSSPVESHSDVKQLQKLVLAAIAQLKKLPRHGVLTYTECKSLEAHLKMIYVQIEVDAHVQKAEVAEEAGDKTLAGYHYRAAQNKLAQSKYHGSDKREKMVELGNLIRALFDNSKA